MSRDLKIVSAAMLTWGLGEGMFYIFQPLYIQEFGADPILIGTILGINGIVMTVSQIPSGYLADRWGRRPLMWFSWIAGLAATWVMALSPSLGFYVAGLLLYGVTSSVLAPLNTYIQGARGQWSVGRAISFVSAAYNIGGVLGPLLGGFVAERFDLRSVYYGSGVVFILSAGIILFARRQPIASAEVDAKEPHLFRNTRFLRMLGLIFLVMFAVILPQPLAANFLQNQRGLSLGRIGQLGSLGALGGVILMLVFGQLPAGLALIFGQGALVLFSLMLWRGETLFWYGLGYFFLGGFRLCRAMTVALVRPAVREVEVGLAFGVVESLNSLSFVVAPPLAGFLYDREPWLVFPVSLGVLALTLFFSILQVRFRARGGDSRQGVSLVEVEVEDDA